MMGIYAKGVVPLAVWGMAVLSGAYAQTLETRVLAEQSIYPRHNVTDVYTPVGHAQGQSFLVTPNENHHPVVIQVTPSGDVLRVYLDAERGHA